MNTKAKLNPKQHMHIIRVIKKVKASGHIQTQSFRFRIFNQRNQKTLIQNAIVKL